MLDASSAALLSLLWCTCSSEVELKFTAAPPPSLMEVGLCFWYDRFMNTQNRITKWSLTIGIVIVLNLFFNYATSLVYKEPDFNNFCPSEQVVKVTENQDECISKGGQWTENVYYGKQTQVGVVEPRGYCDLQYTCRQDYDSASKTYGKNVFIVLVVLGALSVLAGTFFKGNDVIGGSLSMAGVFSFIIASMRYWSAASDAIRVLILAIALAILFWIAYKRFRNNG